MSVHKIIIDADPGIGDAIAISLSMFDPRLEVLAVTATAGAVAGKQANRNIQLLLNYLDLPKVPRVGYCVDDLPRCLAPDENYPLDLLNGPAGLGEFELDFSLPHHRLDSGKVIAETVKAHPGEVTVITLGPFTNLAMAAEYLPDFASQVKSVVCLAGIWEGAGEITAVAEQNIYHDPESAKRVLQKKIPLVLLPVDLARQVQCSFSDLENLPLSDRLPFPSLLSKLLPFGQRMARHHLGREGFSLQEVAALAVVSRPELFTRQTVTLDIETRGELTRGMTIFDRRIQQQNSSNIEVIKSLNKDEILAYFTRIVCNSVR
jgi:inosine-uridine nucleoside N-ribohydrolase